jgi:AcrR family transcriptional regulator
MIENEFVSSRSLKTKETKNKIIKAANDLLKSYGYDYLTIRNVCKAASVSTGTFYHHFNSMDGVLLHLTRSAFAKYKMDQENKIKSMNSLEQIIDAYLWYIGFFTDQGIEFTSNYFTVKNQALKIRIIQGAEIDNSAVLPDSSIAKNMLQLVNIAQNEDLLTKEYDATTIFHNIDVVMFGVIFEWCLSGGRYNIKERLSDMLRVQISQYKI